MPDTLSRAVFDSLLPPGSLWVPRIGGDLDLLLEGIADNSQEMVDFLEGLSHLRDPQRTPLLEDLETEYGIRPDSRKSDSERRAGLTAAVTGGAIDGSFDTLQAKLTQAGFEVTVYVNSPPTDPENLVQAIPVPTICGAAEAICGAAGIDCGGEATASLLVNGEIFGDVNFFEFPEGNYHPITSCGDPGVPVCGQTGITCGAVYSENSYWSLFFFIGGTAHYTADGVLESMDFAEIPVTRRDEFKRLVLKYKPMHSWAVLILSFS